MKGTRELQDRRRVRNIVGDTTSTDMEVEDMGVEDMVATTAHIMVEEIEEAEEEVKATKEEKVAVRMISLEDQMTCWDMFSR